MKRASSALSSRSRITAAALRRRTTSGCSTCSVARARKTSRAKASGLRTCAAWSATSAARSRCSRRSNKERRCNSTCRATCARSWPRKPEPHDVNNKARPVIIVMIEDDEGHARLIEKNIRRAGVHNEIMPFVNGGEALRYLLGDDESGEVSAGRQLLILL